MEIVGEKVQNGRCWHEEIHNWKVHELHDNRLQKIVVGQVQELQVLWHDIHAKNMKLSESFKVASLFMERFKKLSLVQKERYELGRTYCPTKDRRRQQKDWKDICYTV